MEYVFIDYLSLIDEYDIGILYPLVSFSVCWPICPSHVCNICPSHVCNFVNFALTAVVIEMIFGMYILMTHMTGPKSQTYVHETHG